MSRQSHHPQYRGYRIRVSTSVHGLLLEKAGRIAHDTDLVLLVLSPIDAVPDICCTQMALQVIAMHLDNERAASRRRGASGFRLQAPSTVVNRRARGCFAQTQRRSAQTTR